MPDRPKRPMSAYLLWFNSVREQLKSEYPGLKVTEIAKKAGEIWRSMKDKSVWEEKATRAKEQYARDIKSYNARGDGSKRRRPATTRYKDYDDTDSEDSEESD